MLDENGFLTLKKNQVHRNDLTMLVRELKPIEFMSDDELLNTPAGSMFTFDVECYVNFFYIEFECVATGKHVAFEQSPDSRINLQKLNWMLWRFCLVSFNGNNYDLPMISLALKGATCEELKKASDFIIKSEVKITPYIFQKTYGVKIEKYNHIDLIEVAPLQGSLKLYAGRLHCNRMQDLPFHEAQVLSREDAEILRPYCGNDLSNTTLLLNELASEIELRIEMSEKYNVDLRSKSDAQVAEAVINSELQKVLGYYPKKPTLSDDTVLQYNVPDFVSYQSPALNEMLNTIKNARFYLDGIGSPIMPKELEKLHVSIGGGTYKLGMGGLHSTEKSVRYVADDLTIIADNDVVSYYPRIILNQMLYPSHLGTAFLQVYESIVKTRIDAKNKSAILKKQGDKDESKRWKTIADSLKITINGSFGKLGNKYSTLYAPQLMLQVTITGQLCLLMLIEMLDNVGINVISGNTDGVVSMYKKVDHEKVRKVIAEWEKITNFETEETRYSEVCSRDVNTYIAVKVEGGDDEARFLDDRLGCKTKGAYSERGSALNSILSKNPETLICTDAILQLIKNKTPIEKTIKECKDIRRFLALKNVKGGGQKDGIYLGKVVRWYYPKNEHGFISYVMSGNKVGKTDGARPIMDLPETFPNDVDYERYIKTAIDMLYDCGYYKASSTLFLF
jgi:hypothetical protein